MLANSYKKLAIFFIILFSCSFIFESFAKEEFLPDKQEKRAQKLFLQIKCPVCKGQVIEDSNAQIAFDLRKLIRNKISQGQSDEEILNFLVKNYGEEILTSPPLSKETLFLWFSPLIFLILGILALLIWRQNYLKKSINISK